MNVMKNLKCLIPFFTSVMLMSCSGSSETPVAVVPEPDTKVVVPDPDTKVPDPDTKVPDPGTKVPDPDPGTKAVVIVPEPETTTPALTLTFTPTKTFQFTWEKVTNATSYKIREDINSGGDYQDITTTTATARSFDHIVPLHARVNARYVLQSCIEGKCVTSEAVYTSTRLADMTSSIGYFKASNTGADDKFGSSVSLSEDGNTLAVGALGEGSGAGAVYVFTYSGAVWSQQAYLKASNAGINDRFGSNVSLSEDGNTLVVAAHNEGSNAKMVVGVKPDQTDNNAQGSGAAYVFTRTGAGSSAMWAQQAYLKASNTDQGDNFGRSVSLSDDGNTLAVSSPLERSNATWSNSSGTPLNQMDNSFQNAGAVYVFLRTGAGTDDVMWQQQAYLKATNTEEHDKFGSSVSLNGDGNTLAVGATGEASSEGAVFVFIRTGASWSHQAKLKATNKQANDQFGSSVSISDDGNTIAVAATLEDSAVTGVSSESHTDNGSQGSGAAYVFIRTGAGSDPDPVIWSHQAYLKASNTDVLDLFGSSISISADGNTLAVGAFGEDSGAAGINDEDEGNIMVSGSLTDNYTGAVYTFTRSNATWSPQAYIKASNTGAGDEFGHSVALSADGGTLAVGARNEDSNAIGVNAGKDNNDAGDAGAVYVY